MTNISVSGTDLSTLGFSVQTVNARGVAGWKPQQAVILNRYENVDLGGGYDTGTTTVLSGTLSAPTDVASYRADHNKAFFLNLLAELKILLDPELGYQKLIITGDDTAHYRWCRLSDAPLEEQIPAFTRPFNAFELTFTNLEPWWRQAATQQTLTGAPSVTHSLPNSGKKTRPTVVLTVSTAADASTPHTLFSIDGTEVIWQSDETLLDFVIGDVITVDCDNLTVTINKNAAPTVARDAIRAISISPASADVFPTIAPGGSTITQKDSIFASAVVNYDLLTL